MILSTLLHFTTVNNKSQVKSEWEVTQFIYIYIHIYDF